MMVGKRLSVYVTSTPVDDRHDYEHYCTVTDFVKRFVNRLMNNTMKIITNMDSGYYGFGTEFRRMGYFGTEWPTIGSVNPHNGFESIQREMATWNSLPPLNNWMFYIDFVGLQYNASANLYTYQVLWSVPTPAYPEPQVTVSVFFYISASLVQPPHFPVEVTYIFEAQKFAHDLNMIFRPKWLYDILDMKTMMFKTFTF